jgi:FAD/FMN-containing dehydrogenase
VKHITVLNESAQTHASKSNVRGGQMSASTIDVAGLERESALGATAIVPGEKPHWPGWEDSAVPPYKLGNYLRDLRTLLDSYGYKSSFYGHFGQGCLHERIDFDLETKAGIEQFRAASRTAAARR